MPLKPGHSRAVISQNIREMVAAGYSQKRAVAAALRNARATGLHGLGASTFPKRCACGKSYDRAAWSLLPFPKRGGHTDFDETTTLEMRNCACGSTMAIEVDPKTHEPLGGLRAPAGLGGLGSIFAYRRASLYFVHMPGCPLCAEFRGPFAEFAAGLKNGEARIAAIDLSTIKDLSAIPFKVVETPTIVLFCQGQEHRYPVTTAPATAAGLMKWYRERVR